MLKSGGERSQRGFTIVELMIALSVLSTILVMATFIMIQIGALYTKGVNAANLQNANRNTIGDLSGNLQLSGNAPLPCTEALGGATCHTTPDPEDHASSHQNPVTYNGVRVYAYCINVTRYSYVMYREQGSGTGEVPHVLWRDTITSPSACWPLNITQASVTQDDANANPGQPSEGFNLVPNHVRLTRFQVAEEPANSGIYGIKTYLAFGDDDLLCDSGTAGDCDATDTSTHLDNPNLPAGDILCKSITGQQFCATSQLSSTVTRRVIN